jgi:hypothetical protein
MHALCRDILNSPALLSFVFKSFCDLMFPCPWFCENLPPEKQMVLQKQNKSYGNLPTQKEHIRYLIKVIN